MVSRLTYFGLDMARWLRAIARPVTLAIAATSAVLAPAALAQSVGSLLIWPIHPVIEANANAAALWLENPGKAPITLQVQSYAWAQSAGKDVYAPQKDVIATPAIVTIEPGAKQLVRLTRLGPPPSEAERAYRLIVDEIPVAREAAQTAPGASLQFRMRYSLPLFIYGPVVPSSKALPAPTLSWAFAQNGTETYIEIANHSHNHARLTAGKLTGSGKIIDLAEGLLGYVLPGSILRIPLPAGAASIPIASLTASINGTAETIIHRNAQ